MTAYLELLLEQNAACKQHVTILTPKETLQRGCQLSLVFDTPVRAVFDKLAEEGIICDKREPDVIRIAPTPMYNTFEDVREFVHVLGKCLQ